MFTVHGPFEANDLPAVDLARVAACVADLAAPERWCVDALHPARDGGRTVAVRGDEGRLGHFAVADRRAVHEGLVRQVHEVVDHEPVVAVDADHLAVAGPGGVVVPVHVGHERGVGLGRIAGPDPDEAVLLDHRKVAHARRGVERFLARHVGAAALAVVDQAVVAADQLVAFEAAERERHQPVPAGVFERGDLAVGAAEHHQLLVADGARQQRVTHFDVVGGGIPGVQRKGGRGRFHEYPMYTEIRKYPVHERLIRG
jgi:hypothetical protein